MTTGDPLPSEVTMSRAPIMLANDDGTDPEPVTDEELGIRPKGRRRRKAAAPPKLVDSGGASPDLVVGLVERSPRVRIVVSIGEFENQLRVGIRQWRITARSGEEFRPTTKGISLLGWELDAVLDALAKARATIAEHRPGALERPAGSQEGGEDGR